MPEIDIPAGKLSGKGDKYTPRESNPSVFFRKISIFEIFILV